MEEKIRDKQLIEEFKKGNQEAFDELIERHSQKMYHTAYGLLSSREDAEEVVQDAFVRAYKAMKNFRGDSSFETWLYRIVVNLSRNRYHWNRRRGSEVKVSLNREIGSMEDRKEEEMAVPDNKLKPDTILEGVELEENIMKGFKKLPDPIRETMTLRHLNDFPYEKISEMLGCKLGTVKSRIARGREMLRSIIEGLEKDRQGT